MKKDFSAIAVIIDASDSMATLTQDTIGSFNQFLAEQKVVPGEAAFSLCTFNTHYSLVHDFIALANVPDLNAKTYRPTGGTALLDAMGTTIDSLGAKLATMPEEDRPSKVIVLVITDGEENSSHTFTLEQIKAKVTHQQEAYNWSFVFMGANIDAISAGATMGFTTANSVQYDATSVGTENLYRSVSANMTSYRSSVGSSKSFFEQPIADAPVIANGIDAVPICDLSGNTLTFVFDPKNPSVSGDLGGTFPTPKVKDFDPGHPLPVNKK
jgi:uncharacterized protein YegL